MYLRGTVEGLSACVKVGASVEARSAISWLCQLSSRSGYLSPRVTSFIVSSEFFMLRFGWIVRVNL
jgi:hypothetical protein